MKLAPSLHRVGNDIVAAYLVEDPTGVTVIDAGVSGQWRELLDELQAMRRMSLYTSTRPTLRARVARRSRRSAGARFGSVRCCASSGMPGVAVVCERHT